MAAAGAAWWEGEWSEWEEEEEAEEEAGLSSAGCVLKRKSRAS